jgi:hypothetical protein
MDNMIPETSINANTISSMARNVFSDGIASVAILSIAGVNVVRQLRLIENSQSMIAIPFNQVFYGMFDGKSVSNNVVTVYDDTICDWI